MLKEICDFVGATLDQNTENVKNLNEWLRFFRRGDDHEDESEDGNDDLQNGNSCGGRGSGIDDILWTEIVHQEPGTTGFRPGRPADQETGKGYRNLGVEDKETWNGHWNLEMQDPRSQKHQEDVNERIVEICQKFESLLENQLQGIQYVLHGAEGGQVKGISLGHLRQSYQRVKTSKDWQEE